MSLETVAVLAGLILVYALVSRLADGAWLTAPLVFTVLGVALGPAGAGLTGLDMTREGLHLLAEATLLLILFTDAARIDLRTLRAQYVLPVRLLGIGLPLTIAAGAVTARAVLPELGWEGALLLSAVLAPTDAALGQAVVDSPDVPRRIRQTLNVESGLNDGLALPVVTTLVAFMLAENEGASVSASVVSGLRQTGAGVLTGAVLGAAAAWAVSAATERRWSLGGFRQLATFAVPVLAYVCAGLVGGNGFVATFTAGLLFGHVAAANCRGITNFASDEGLLLEVIVFFAFGATLLGPALRASTPAVLVYAVLSLTVVRMVPVATSLVGTHILPVTSAFLGWFGPRGLASILFALLVVEENVPHAGDIRLVTTVTVGLSIVAHGLSATPLSDRYGQRLATRLADVEHRPMPASPGRRGGG